MPSTSGAIYDAFTENACSCDLSGRQMQLWQKLYKMLSLYGHHDVMLYTPLLLNMLKVSRSQFLRNRQALVEHGFLSIRQTGEQQTFYTLLLNGKPIEFVTINKPKTLSEPFSPEVKQALREPLAQKPSALPESTALFQQPKQLANQLVNQQQNQQANEIAKQLLASEDSHSDSFDNFNEFHNFNNHSNNRFNNHGCNKGASGKSQADGLIYANDRAHDKDRHKHDYETGNGTSSNTSCDTAWPAMAYTVEAGTMLCQSNTFAIQGQGLHGGDVMLNHHYSDTLRDFCSLYRNAALQSNLRQWADIRRKNGWTLTPWGLHTLLEKLRVLGNDNADAMAAIVQQSIKRRWKGFYALQTPCSPSGAALRKLEETAAHNRPQHRKPVYATQNFKSKERDLSVLEC